MSDQLHTYIEPELEARITALVLGEASEFEVDELERLIEEKPELAVFRRRVQMMHDLEGDAIKPQQDKKWQLSEGRRTALRQAFANKGQATEQSTISKPKGRRVSAGRKQIRASVVIAACVMLCFVLFMMATPSYDRGPNEAPASDFASYMADEEFESEGISIIGGSSFQLDVKQITESRSKAPAEKSVAQNGRVPTIGDLPATGGLFKNKGNQRDLARSVERKPSSPTSSMGRAIASNKKNSDPCS